jgi:hypothetical protein
MRHFSGRLSAFCLAALLAWPSFAQEEQAEIEVEEAIEEPPRFTSRAERDRHLLASAFPEQAQRLNTPEGELLVLYKPALHAESKGTLMMVHSADSPGDWPPAWENLRRALPYFGWATLALTVPTPPGPDIPPRPVEAPPVEENGDPEAPAREATPEETVPLTREQRISARLDAALGILQPAENVVLLVDNVNAPAVFAHIEPGLRLAEPGIQPGHSPLAGPVRALVLANLYPSQPLSQAQVQKLFSVSELPILDMFPAADTPANRRQRQLHRGLAQRQNLIHYQALSLPQLVVADLDDQSGYWVVRLQGFMTRQNMDTATVVRRFD